MKLPVFSIFLLVVGFVHAGPREGMSGGIPAFLDSDGDGTISEAERQAFADLRRQARGGGFEKWDTDGDGTIDPQEREAALAHMRDLVQEQRCRLFEGVAGPDGVLTLEEAKARILPFSQLPDPVAARIFSLLDGDGDGGVTKAEFLGKLGRPTRPGAPAP